MPASKPIFMTEIQLQKFKYHKYNNNQTKPASHIIHIFFN